jgi:hypothetical protein
MPTASSSSIPSLSSIILFCRVPGSIFTARRTVCHITVVCVCVRAGAGVNGVHKFIKMNKIIELNKGT